MYHRAILSVLVAASLAAPSRAADTPAHLPNELSAEEILNGAYPYPKSPRTFDIRYSDEGMAMDRLGKVPAPGVHPRVLISPDQLPELKQRLTESTTGKAAFAELKDRLDKSIRKQGSWSSEAYELLAAGNLKQFAERLKVEKTLPGIGHYQTYLTALAMEAFRCLLENDTAGGKKVAAAVANYSRVILPVLEKERTVALNDDTWRARPDPSTAKGDTAVWPANSNGRDLTGYQMLGYAYDYSAPFMTEEQKAVTRKAIASATNGRLWLGARLPHHLRDWNWVAVGTSSPLLALAIEGEEGYDPRLFKLGSEIARDYLTYGISPAGSSTEAVGYTQFGLNWLNPFLVAMARRGEPGLAHPHRRAMLDWYLYSLDPVGGKWTSHGDGGDRGPSPQSILMDRYFFPDDQRADFLWQNILQASGGEPFGKGEKLFEAVLWATDPMSTRDGKPVDHAGGASLGLAKEHFDPDRGSLNSRSDWGANATAVQFECRTDSFGPSHEHADRGSFTLHALGRDWAKENFRSVETRHHNSILIDGLGQGFWPGPGEWLGLASNAWATIAAIDAKPAYDWVWPKQITTEPQDFIRFRYPRWADYKTAAAVTAHRFQGLQQEKDPRPAVTKQWKGFVEIGDPRVWDEDTWPARFPHNRVERAFRSIAFIKEPNPYLLVVDDIQKDKAERLYEWLMQTGLNTELYSVSGNDLLLCDATVPRGTDGQPTPRKGDRALLVRILEKSEPKLERDYQARPSVRLETFERKDTLAPDGRTFGLDRRLVIPSRSAAPDFKILLYPFRVGDPLPETKWSEDGKALTIKSAGASDTVVFTKNSNGRSIIAIQRGDQTLSLP